MFFVKPKYISVKNAKSNQRLINKQQKLYAQSKQQILSTTMQVGQDEAQFLIEKNIKVKGSWNYIQADGQEIVK